VGGRHHFALFDRDPVGRRYESVRGESAKTFSSAQADAGSQAAQAGAFA